MLDAKWCFLFKATFDEDVSNELTFVLAVDCFVLSAGVVTVVVVSDIVVGGKSKFDTHF